MLRCPDNCATKIGLASVNIQDDDDADNTDLTMMMKKVTRGRNAVSGGFICTFPMGVITSRLDSE